MENVAYFELYVYLNTANIHSKIESVLTEFIWLKHGRSGKV